MQIAEVSRRFSPECSAEVLLSPPNSRKSGNQEGQLKRSARDLQSDSHSSYMQWLNLCVQSYIVYNIQCSETATPVTRKRLHRRNALKLLGGAIAATYLDLPAILLAEDQVEIAGR